MAGANFPDGGLDRTWEFDPGRSRMAMMPATRQRMTAEEYLALPVQPNGRRRELLFSGARA